MRRRNLFKNELPVLRSNDARRLFFRRLNRRANVFPAIDAGDQNTRTGLFNMVCFDRGLRRYVVCKIWAILA